jgi:hypothetical protein
MTQVIISENSRSFYRIKHCNFFPNDFISMTPYNLVAFNQTKFDIDLLNYLKCDFDSMYVIPMGAFQSYIAVGKVNNTTIFLGGIYEHTK